MTPAARAAAAIAVLDRALAGVPVEQALLGWSRASRYAGSGDRAAVRDLVFDALRRRRSRAARGGSDTGRGLILGWCREAGRDPATIFGAGAHAPEALTAAEAASGRDPTADEATDLPDWLLPPLRRSLGDEFQKVAEAFGDRAPVWLRVNRLRATPEAARAALLAEGIDAIPRPGWSEALRVQTGARGIARSRAYLVGLVELQDLSPQLAVAALGDVRGLRTLDLCAGGGGKALALMAAGAQVQAHDIDPGRMADLPARARRAGAQVVIAPPRGTYDLVVVDAPCSGSGTWRRDPAGRWRLTPEKLRAVQAAQRQILADATPLVAPGGRLAYMTCSLLDDENGNQINWLEDGGALTEISRHHFGPLRESDGFFLSILQRS